MPLPFDQLEVIIGDATYKKILAALPADLRAEVEQTVQRVLPGLAWAEEDVSSAVGNAINELAEDDGVPEFNPDDLLARQDELMVEYMSAERPPLDTVAMQSSLNQDVADWLKGKLTLEAEKSHG